jgi:hypothetical protein
MRSFTVTVHRTAPRDFRFGREAVLWVCGGVPEALKNERRRARSRRRHQLRCLLRVVENYLQFDEQHDPYKVFVIELPGILHYKRCEACGGRGHKERRDKPQGWVVCRVCQGAGAIHRLGPDGKIFALRPSKVYYHRQRWEPRSPDMYEWPPREQERSAIGRRAGSLGPVVRPAPSIPAPTAGAP